MSLTRLVAGSRGAVGNSTGADIATNVNSLIDTGVTDFQKKTLANLSSPYTQAVGRQSEFTAADITENAASQITSGVAVADDAPIAYTLKGALRSWLTTASGFKRALSEDKSIAVYTTRSFIYDGSEIEFKLRTLTNSATVFVDGLLVGSFSISNTNAPAYFRLDMTTAAARRIDIFAGGGIYWGGLIKEPSTTVIAVDEDLINVAVMGDSFTQGTGSGEAKGYSNQLGMIFPNLNMFSLGIGGSGYVNNGGTGKFINRIDELIATSPDYIITAGGINDIAETFATFTAAVDAYYTALIAASSVEKIIIIGLWNPASATATSIQFNDYLRTKAQALNVPFIDTIDPVNGEWITGTGNAAGLLGDGNADMYTSSDGTHPTQAGHTYLAKRVAKELMRISRYNGA